MGIPPTGIGSCRQGVRVKLKAVWDGLKKVDLSFLNSAFVVTMLGGVLAGLITSCWQSKAAHNAYQRAVLEHQLQDRRSAAKEFADGFGGALYFFNDYLMRRLWIAGHYQELSHVYPDGRDFASERAIFEAIESKTYSHPTPESLAQRVAMTFSSERVEHSVHKLLETINKMVVDNDQKALQIDFDIANSYDDLISDMQQEIVSFEWRWETAK
jgi:hypothetical protein